MLRHLHTAFLGLLLASGALGFVRPAHAGDHGPRCEPAPRYEWVMTHECRREAYRVCETRVDECGRTHTVTVTRYRTVRVPVWQYVRVR